MGIKLKHKKTEDTKYDHVSCSCGLHFGIGIWSAEHRARVYAWFRDVYKAGYDSTRRAWLQSYEYKHHHQTAYTAAPEEIHSQIGLI